MATAKVVVNAAGVGRTMTPTSGIQPSLCAVADRLSRMSGTTMALVAACTTKSVVRTALTAVGATRWLRAGSRREPLAVATRGRFMSTFGAQNAPTRGMAIAAPTAESAVGQSGQMIRMAGTAAPRIADAEIGGTE